MSQSLSKSGASTAGRASDNDPLAPLGLLVAHPVLQQSGYILNDFLSVLLLSLHLHLVVVVLVHLFHVSYVQVVFLLVGPSHPLLIIRWNVVVALLHFLQTAFQNGGLVEIDEDEGVRQDALLLHVEGL